MGLARFLDRQRRRARRQSMRLCDGCHAAVARDDLRRDGERWLCAGCSGETAGEPEAPVLAGASEASEEAEHWWTPYAWLGARLVVYLLALWLAHSNRILGLVLHGALLGDVVGWGVERLAALRQTQLVALFEFFGYLTVVWLCYDLPGALSLPDALEDRAIVGLAFIAVFAARVTLLALRLRLEPGEDDHLTW